MGLKSLPSLPAVSAANTSLPEPGRGSDAAI